MKQGLRTKLTLIAIAISVPLLAAAQTTKPATGGQKEAAGMAKQAGNAYFTQLFNNMNRPAWMTRTDIGYDTFAKNTPFTYLETIQPLYETVTSTLFWQGRIAYNSGDTTGNLGLGYRHLSLDKKLMLGMNAFYDEQFQHTHKRVGLGGELFTPYLTFRVNYYDAISGQRTIATTNGGLTSYYEKALSGYDIGVETPVPYVSWMRFVAQAYHWDGVNAPNIDGGQANLRIFPAKQLEVDAGFASDNNAGGQAFLKLNYYFGAADFIENSASTPHSTGTFAPQDLEKQRLQKVIRNNAIVIEKTNTPVVTNIIVARGT